MKWAEGSPHSPLMNSQPGCHLFLTSSAHKDLVPQGDSSSPAGMDPHRQWLNQGPFLKGDIVRKSKESFNTLS